jgi:plasmid stability protein
MAQEHKMMVRMPEALHRAVRVKAAELGRPISKIVRDLLVGWLSGKIELPEESEEETAEE